MRRVTIPQALLLASSVVAVAASVGSGSTPAVQQSFLNAYFRGNFALYVLTPTADVRAFSTGLIQEFPSSVGGSTQRGALIKPNPTAPVSINDTLQVLPDLYTYYSAIGVNTAGFPTIDTTPCPANSTGTCNYQLFARNYALFAYSAPIPANYQVIDPIFTAWQNAGGVGGALGVVQSATSAVSSVLATSGTQQLFDGGGVYSYTTPGTSTVVTYPVGGSFFTAFAGAGGIGALGFPTSDETLLSSGLRRQSFQNGRIEATSSGAPTVLFPLKEITLSIGADKTTLKLGDTASITASLFDTRGSGVSGRTLTWATSNGSAVSVQPNGYSATIRAVGTGVARITATSEGVTSIAITVTVVGQCCAVGEGAPQSSVSQAFQLAAARNNLSLLLPNPTPVTRTGAGYVQLFTSPDGATVYAISQADGAVTAYVSTGRLYAAYLSTGGFTGSLGFPASDPSPGGTQFYTSGSALTGSTIRIVPPPIAAKWAERGAETGILGPVSSDAATFTSIGGTSGNVQSFTGGTVFGTTSGPFAGTANFSTGLILARYLALGGPASPLGLPVSDTFTNGGVLVQNFETGFIDLQPGATAAVEHYNPRNPTVTTSPFRVAPGGRVKVTVAGFAFGANLTITLTGASPFTVNAKGGQFSWDIVIPATAKSGTVAVTARSSPGTDTASGAYNIVTLDQLRPGLSIVSGNQQSGSPGATLPSPLVATVADINGNPLAGVPVAYAASPGGVITGTAVTDATGRVYASLRLPPSQGVAGATVSAAGQVITFNALAVAKKLANFPAFVQSGATDGPIAALAALVRFHQNAGTLAAPNGLATVASLTQYLTSNTGLISTESGTSIPNPWAAARFGGLTGGISLEAPTIERVRDLLSQGVPSAIHLSLTTDGAPSGGAMVDATGIEADGSVAIMDPNPAYARVSLSDYLNGFVYQGRRVQATITGVLRMDPALSTPTGFVVASSTRGAAVADSIYGSCSAPFEILDGTGGIRFLVCDGSQTEYQLGFAVNTGATVFDLGLVGVFTPVPANSTLAWKIVRENGALAVSPQTLAISGLTNTAGFGSGLAPGGIFSIFGAGFTAAGSGSTVSINGVNAPVVVSLPFQINARMPGNIPIGQATIAVASPLGTVSRTATISGVAPGIFTIGAGDGTLARGAIVNQDGSINSVTNPAVRGDFISIYGTGFGVTTAQGSLQAVTSAVTVFIGGVSVRPSFAGLTPGVPGLYQVNVQTPAGLAPGSFVEVYVQQGNAVSNKAALSVE